LDNLERLAIFIGILVIMMVWEFYSPRRKLHYTRRQRWLSNISLSIINVLVLRFSIAGAAVWASTSTTNQWGLLHLIDLPNWLAIIISIVLLDLAIYGQHRASHQWSWLWRLHKIHHTDLDLDVTSAVRFHPIEIVLSMCYKVICIYIIGASPVAVIAFEIILSSCALFNHSNITIPLTLDKLIRLFIVTPDMHRIHHSVIPSETNSNYGFSISVWDRIFATYIDQPQAGHINMTIGLAEYQYIEDVAIQRLLLMPFKNSTHV